MDSLFLEATKSTPDVTFDPEQGVFEISGKSRPEHVNEFYEPIFNWLDSYKAELAASGKMINIPFKIYFSYLNTSSEKTLLRLVKKLKEFKNSGHTLEIIWCHTDEDEDIREMGVDFQGLTDMQFTFVVVD